MNRRDFFYKSAGFGTITCFTRVGAEEAQAADEVDNTVEEFVLPDSIEYKGLTMDVEPLPNNEFFLRLQQPEGSMAEYAPAYSRGAFEPWMSAEVRETEIMLHADGLYRLYTKAREQFGPITHAMVDDANQFVSNNSR